MIEVKLSTCAPLWPWLRQMPGGQAEWGPFRFHVDSDVRDCDMWVVFESLEKTEIVGCPPERVIFIAGEPDSIGSYQTEFLKQFFYVISGRQDLTHPRQLRIQQGHPWFVERSYDELFSLPPVVKTRDVCVISSDKAFTEGHQQRLAFVEILKQKLGDRLDVYGRGIRGFDSKWDVLAPYRYAIVLENFSGDDFLTEKLPDAWLAYCFPLYFGCTNVGRYFKEGAWQEISLNQPEAAAAAVIELIDDPSNYEQRLPAIISAREHYLNHAQFFANLSNILQSVLSSTSGKCEQVTLHPNSAVFKLPEAPAAPPENITWRDKYKHWWSSKV
ncbi:glycosyltransferase family 10 [Herbaspirillum rhizosphaerae]|uniref:Glycosyltransferase family 10 n=1 Tax=Herbaspirillum rhizosphaerae TaxID=346179 RepID=A0ABW8Z7U3_9BURK